MPDVEKFFNANRTKKAKDAFQLMFQPVPNYNQAQPILQKLADEWRSQGSIDELKKTLSLAAKILGTNPPPAAIAPAINNAAKQVSQALNLAKKILGTNNQQLKKALDLASKILKTQKPVSLNKNAKSLKNLNNIMNRIYQEAGEGADNVTRARTYMTLRGRDFIEKNKSINTELKYNKLWKAINETPTSIINTSKRSPISNYTNNQLTGYMKIANTKNYKKFTRSRTDAPWIEDTGMYFKNNKGQLIPRPPPRPGTRGGELYREIL